MTNIKSWRRLYQIGSGKAKLSKLTDLWEGEFDHLNSLKGTDSDQSIET